MMLIDNKFNLGDVVFLRTDPDQHTRIITGIKICPESLMYCLTFGIQETEHYEMEISKEKSHAYL